MSVRNANLMNKINYFLNKKITGQSGASQGKGILVTSRKIYLAAACYYLYCIEHFVGRFTLELYLFRCEVAFSDL